MNDDIIDVFDMIVDTLDFTVVDMSVILYI